MRNEILQELHAEYEQQRSRNTAEELKRRNQAETAIPGLTAALTARENLIFDNLNSILSGRKPATDIPEQVENCNRQIVSLLKAGGFAEDWLEPVYRCRNCQDTGYVGEPVREMCSCLRNRYYTRLCRAIGLSDDDSGSYDRWNQSMFSDQADPGYGISPRQAMDLVRRETMKWTDVWPSTGIHTIVLSGKSGLGKTYTLHCMAGRLLSRGVNVMLVSAYHLLDVSRKAYFSGRSEEYDSLMTADVLMIDDLGSEPLFDNVTVTQLFNLINERQTSGQATIFSTNLTMKEIRDRYTERIASRLSDIRTSREYRFFGADLRTAKEKL